MQFEDFLNNRLKLQKSEVPGENAHLDMIPAERAESLKTLNIAKRKPRHAGVVALFYPEDDGSTHLMLILRKTYRGVHSNQIGFPGGKLEATDRDIEAAAVREVEEEIGVPREQIKILKKMTKVYIPPSNFWVQPFVGYVAKKPQFRKQDYEVEALIPLSVEDFLRPGIRITSAVTASYAVDVEVPAYKVRGHIVWGATAMMLAEIRQFLQPIHNSDYL